MWLLCWLSIFCHPQKLLITHFHNLERRTKLARKWKNNPISQSFARQKIFIYWTSNIERGKQKNEFSLLGFLTRWYCRKNWSIMEFNLYFYAQIVDWWDFIANARRTMCYNQKCFTTKRNPLCDLDCTFTTIKLFLNKFFRNISRESIVKEVDVMFAMSEINLDKDNQSNIRINQGYYDSLKVLIPPQFVSIDRVIWYFHDFSDQIQGFGLIYSWKNIKDLSTVITFDLLHQHDFP